MESPLCWMGGVGDDLLDAGLDVSAAAEPTTATVAMNVTGDVELGV